MIPNPKRELLQAPQFAYTDAVLLTYGLFENTISKKNGENRKWNDTHQTRSLKNVQ